MHNTCQLGRADFFPNGRPLKEVLKTFPGKRLDDVLKTGRRNFHFRPIYDVFETKIEDVLRPLQEFFW